MNLNLQHLCTSVVDIAREVGTYLRHEQSKLKSEQIETKSLNSLVSYVDKTAEKQLVEKLTVLLPEAGFIAEEGTGAPVEGGLNWIVDPLDGTTNYMHGLPLYAISIALSVGSDLVVGVVYEVGNDEMFSAYQGGGSFLNGQKIQVANRGTLSNTLLATGFPYYDFDRMPAYLKVLEQLFPKTRGLRRFGSAATDLAWVAAGRFDAYFEYSLSPWDVAAGIVLVREAGGVVSNFSNGDEAVFAAEIIAGAPAIHEELLPILAPLAR